MQEAESPDVFGALTPSVIRLGLHDRAKINPSEAARYSLGKPEQDLVLHYPRLGLLTSTGQGSWELCSVS